VLPTTRDARRHARRARSAYVLYGIEPGLDFADQALALKALSGAQVVASATTPCESTRKVADVILPIGALPEIDGSLTNLEGRVQHGVAGGKLPGQARAGWRVLRAVGSRTRRRRFDFTEYAGMRAGLSERTVQVAKGATPEARAGSTAPASKSSASQAIYRTDGTVRRAEAPAGASADARRARRAASGGCGRGGRAPDGVAKLATRPARQRCRWRRATGSRAVAHGSNRATARPPRCSRATWRSRRA
jgi:NADH-quinone oxidoreductase subunit G